MIGQVNLLNDIDRIINRFPRFSIITGPKGSGKKTLCKVITNKLGITPLYFGIKIEDIRNAIEMAYTQVQPIAFVIPDADRMSIGAKNSLLKITEEPPKNCYFIMTLESLDNTLDTIKSRGTIFKLDPYNEQELLEYRAYRGYSSNFDNIITMVCNNTGEVDELYSYNVDEFFSFANCVTDNIHIPNNGNTFKITKKIKTKQDDNTCYEASLLLKAIQKLYLKKAKETKDKKYLNASICTSKWGQQLNLPSVNKIGIMDMWIMDVRRILRG